MQERERSYEYRRPEKEWPHEHERPLECKRSHEDKARNAFMFSMLAIYHALIFVTIVLYFLAIFVTKNLRLSSAVARVPFTNACDALVSSVLTSCPSLASAISSQCPSAAFFVEA